MFSTCPSVRPSVCYQSCEHDILKTTEPILLQVGTKRPLIISLTILNYSC